MRSYVFSVVLEPAGDVWRAFIPELEEKGAASWGRTREEAVKNIQKVTQMVVEDLMEDGEPLPLGVMLCDQAAVAVNVE